MPGAGGRARRVLADHRTLGGDALAQGGMAARVGQVRPGAKHRQGDATGRGQSGLVGGGVDPGGQAAGDGHPGPAQRGAEVACVVASAGTGAAAADHSHRRPPQQVRIAIDEQCRRRVRGLAQQRRVARVLEPEQVVAGQCQPGQCRAHAGGLAGQQPAQQGLRIDSGGGRGHCLMLAPERRRRPRAPSRAAVGITRRRAGSTACPDARPRSRPGPA